MGTTLTGKNISASYLGLLKTTDNAVIGSTAKRLTDGNGTDSPLFLSTSQLGIGVTPTEALTISSGNIQLSNDNKLQFGTSDVFIKGTTATDNIQIGLQGATKLTLHQTNGLTLAQYGSGSITGTVTQRLGVTSSGQVVEIPIGGGAVDGSGTAGKITKWSDSDTITDSIMSESGSTIEIAGGGGNGQLNLTRTSGVTLFNQAQASVGVIGTSTNHRLDFKSNNTTALTIDTSQRVGVGISSPDAPLHILKASSGANIVTALKLDPDDATVGSGTSIDFNASSTNTGASLVGARIVGAREGGNASGFLAFYTSPDSSGSVPLERLRLDASGRLGIGTSSPATGYQLTLSGSSTAGLVLNDTGQSGNYQIAANGTTSYWRFDGDNAKSISLNSTGLVGIGVINASSKLHVTDGGTPPTISGTYLISATSASNAGIQINAGNTSASIIAFGDTNSQDVGVIRYDHSDNHMRFDTNGSERMRILSDGKVGINTSSADNFLHVNSGTTNVTSKFESTDATSYINIIDNASAVYGVLLGVTGNDFHITTGASTGTTLNERLRVTSSGDVGIGTDSPNSLLSVGGTFTATTAKPTVAVVDTTSGGSLGIRGQSPILAFDRTASGTPKILMDSGGLEFKDGTLDSEGSVNVKIDSSGNLGLGTSSPDVAGFPSSTLTVEGSSTNYGAFELGSASQTSANGRLGEIRFYNKESANPYGFASIRGLRGSSAGDSHITFFTSSSNTGSERMRILSGGQVSIGGTLTTAKLNVLSATYEILRLHETDSGGGLLRWTNVDDTNGWYAGITGGEKFGISRNTDPDTGAEFIIKQTGEIGIGTASPDRQLHISDDVTGINIQATTGDAFVEYTTADNNAFIGLDNSLNLLKINNTNSLGSANHLAINTSGNIGIGIAPTRDFHLHRSTLPDIHITNNDSGSTSTDGATLTLDALDFLIQNREAGNMRFNVNGSERARITSAGQLGVGVTSPSNKVHIYDATSDAPLRIESGDGYVGIKFKDPDNDDNLFYRGDIESFYFTGARLGINDSSPDYALSVNSSDSQSYAHFINSSTGNTASDGTNVGVNGSDFYIWQRENASAIVGTSATERFRVSGNGNFIIGNTVVNPASGFSDQKGFGYEFSSGHTQIATTSDNVALTIGKNNANDGSIIEIRKESTVIGTFGSNTTGGQPLLDISANSSNGNMRFLTAGSERVRITSGGNVGIGETAPATTLDVRGAGSVSNPASSGTTVSTGTRFRLGQSTSQTRVLDFGIGSSSHGAWLQGTDRSDLGTKMPIALNPNGGDISIGKVAPNFKLDIHNSNTSTAVYQQFSNGTTGSASSDGTVLGIDADGDFLINNQEAKTIKLFTSDSERLRVGSGGNVSINNTVDKGKLSVWGSLTVGSTYDDSDITVTETGDDISVTAARGGYIDVLVPMQGTTTQNCTVTFTYAKVGWASWSLDYEFASTDGFTKGFVGGYNNNSNGNEGATTFEGIDVSLAVTNSGQSTIVTFTFAGAAGMGIHPMAKFRYAQSGGDGMPRADRVTVAYVDGS